MQRDPTVRDGGFNRSAVFLIAAASISKLPVDDLDRQPPGMVGFYRVRQLKQFPLGGLGSREGAVLFELHRAGSFRLSSVPRRGGAGMRTSKRRADRLAKPPGCWGCSESLLTVALYPADP